MFEDFTRKNDQVVIEDDVMSSIVPVIFGSSDIHSKHNVLFTELAPITDEKTVKPKPDFFDGAHLGDLSQELRKDEQLALMIIPTKHRSAPVASNFYLEVKSENAGPIIAVRQACYDGAHGARAMHALQNYGLEEPTFDGDAYTYSSTYHPVGSLQLFAHHVTVPVTDGGRPGYYMTKLRGFDMTDSRETFIAGATAARNIRDLAQRQRDTLIQVAESRVVETSATAVSNPTADARGEPPDPVRYDEYPTSGGTRPDADDAMQQDTADTTNHAASQDSQASAVPSTSMSLSTKTTRLKRPRQVAEQPRKVTRDSKRR